MNALRRAYAQILKRSQLYTRGGWQYAKILKRNLPDLETHFYAFLIDLNLCLLPVYIWILEFLLILCGIIPPNFFDLLFYLMYGLLFVSSVIVLGAVTARMHGQSVGYACTGLKLTLRNRREAPAIKLILRQALSIGLPLMVCGILFNVFGVFIWLLLDGVICLLTPHQQNFMDLLLGLVTVRIPDDEILMQFNTTQARLADHQPEETEEETEASHPVNPIDLHIRSNYSDDGTCDVEEIFKQAKEAGLEIISITDHNCARANAAAMRFAGLYGIQYIPGAEFDCMYKNIRLRILGYYLDWNKPVFDNLERDSLKREKDLSIQRLKKFEEFMGVRLDVSVLLQNSRFQTITAHDLTRMAFRNQKLRTLPQVQKYLDTSSSMKKAMHRFEQDVFGKGGPCHVQAVYPQAEDIIHAIQDSGGLAVLAAWHLDRMSDAMIEKIVKLGVDGIECFSPDLDERTTFRLLQTAVRNKLFVTGGSDFHGTTRPDRVLGAYDLPERGEKLIRKFTKAL